MVGIKPKGKVKLVWSANFAYAIGLLASDGCLSSDGRHILFVSKDEEQCKNYMKSLGVKVLVGTTSSGYKNKKAFRVQFSDVLFYRFLLGIGLTPAKSKTIGEIKVPEKYFFDFLRGSFDGDGCFYSYWDKRWKSSHMFYVTFSSASLLHIEWLRKQINKNNNISGHVSKAYSESSIYSLRYAKKETLVIIKKMYYNHKVICLGRKKVKIQKALATEEKQQKQYC